MLALILVLIITGNLIQTGTQKATGWALYSIVVLLGLIAFFLLYMGTKNKKFMALGITVLMTVLLTLAMIVSNPQETMGVKAGAHIANILFLITLIAVLTMRYRSRESDEGYKTEKKIRKKAAEAAEAAEAEEAEQAA